MSDKIKVICAVDHRCGIDNADLHISRRWAGRGAVVTFTKEQLEELMFDPSFRNMVEDGMLYIDDMEVKKEIGVEPEDAKAPTIILMDEKTLERFWKNMPISQFKLEVQNLTKSQLTSLARYAMNHGDYGTIEKANYLSEISGFQILKGIENNKSTKEA